MISPMRPTVSLHTLPVIEKREGDDPRTGEGPTRAGVPAGEPARLIDSRGNDRRGRSNGHVQHQSRVRTEPDRQTATRVVTTIEHLKAIDPGRPYPGWSRVLVGSDCRPIGGTDTALVLALIESRAP